MRGSLGSGGWTLPVPGGGTSNYPRYGYSGILGRRHGEFFRTHETKIGRQAFGLREVSHTLFVRTLCRLRIVSKSKTLMLNPKLAGRAS